MLKEETTKYVKKLVDPALMTWREFSRAINSAGKSHPETAYKTTYEINKDKEYKSKKKYPTLINRFVSNNMEFELRESIEKGQYVMSDENGDFIRDINGDLLTFNDEELKILGINPYDISLGIFDMDGVMVGSAQNEWGTILITVVEEFRGFGFGQILLKKYRELYPKRDSGGFTPRGYGLTKKYHENAVRDYLAKGFYSFLIKNGHITKEKVKEIVSELPKRNERKEIDLNMQKGKIAVHNSGDNTNFIIYNTKIIPMLLDYKEDRFFIEKGLLGYVHLIYIETRDAYRVFNFLQNPERMGKVLNELLASRLFDEKTPLIVDDVKGMFEKFIDKDLYEIKDGLAYSKARYMDYKSLGRMEKVERLKICDNDRFKAEEAEVLIMELADSLAED